ncbi:MAG TPA: STAS domain-containing protein [Solirubrobacteraceae bacterium]|nr:STAS domain-containing protein [Solirubrobacteraceae bacterium]
MTETTRFEITEHAEGDELLLCLSGELDLASQRRLISRLYQAGDQRASVILDLSRLSFIDSTGLSAIVLAHQDAERDGWSLRIRPELSPSVRQVFMMSGIGPLLGLSDLRP